MATVTGSPVTAINNLLKRAGHGFKLVRGAGYYYFAGDEAGIGLSLPSLYVYRLGAGDFEFALREVNDRLADAGLRMI
jgi:hypothetical protein